MLLCLNWWEEKQAPCSEPMYVVCALKLKTFKALVMVIRYKYINLRLVWQHPMWLHLESALLAFLRNILRLNKVHTAQFLPGSTAEQTVILMNVRRYLMYSCIRIRYLMSKIHLTDLPFSLIVKVINCYYRLNTTDFLNTFCSWKLELAFGIKSAISSSRSFRWSDCTSWRAFSFFTLISKSLLS